MNKKIVVVLPCYNEEPNIVALLDNWEQQREVLLHNENLDLEIVVVNDFSTDNTEAVVKDVIADNSNIRIINHPVNKGLSGGLNTGIDYFIKNFQSGDYLVFMDGDNTHDPAYIHKMVQKIRSGKDCVIASRYCTDSGIAGLAKYREWLSDMAKLYYKVMLNVDNVKDYTCGYRIYTYDIVSKMVQRFGDEPVKEKSFACMMELLYKIYLVGGSFDEVGFKLRYDNKKNASKMQVFKTMRRSLSTAIKLRGMAKDS